MRWFIIICLCLYIFFIANEVDKSNQRIKKLEDVQRQDSIRFEKRIHKSLDRFVTI